MQSTNGYFRDENRSQRFRVSKPTHSFHKAGGCPKEQYFSFPLHLKLLPPGSQPGLPFWLSGRRWVWRGLRLWENQNPEFQLSSNTFAQHKVQELLLSKISFCDTSTCDFPPVYPVYCHQETEGLQFSGIHSFINPTHTSAQEQVSVCSFVSLPPLARRNMRFGLVKELPKGQAINAWGPMYRCDLRRPALGGDPGPFPGGSFSGNHGPTVREGRGASISYKPPNREYV